jgi:hypothetical protein
LRKLWQSKKGKERRKIPDVDHILIDFEEYIGWAKSLGRVPFIIPAHHFEGGNNIFT